MPKAPSPTPWSLLTMTLAEWNQDNVARLSAALAFYTIFSMAPLLVIAVGFAAFFFERDVAQGQLAYQIGVFTDSPEVGELAQTVIENAMRPGASVLAPLVSLLLLLYGATIVFVELKSALNLIWDVSPHEQSGVWYLVIGRLFSLVMVLVSGLLMLLALVATTALAVATNWVNEQWPGMGFTSQAANFVFFLLITMLVFALMYKYVPDLRIAWRDVWIGALATALLFSVGRWFLSLYFSRSTFASTYGAAGSLAVLLLWIYYSAQIFLLGAEFTQVYARTYGTRGWEAVLLKRNGAAAPAVKDGKRPEPELGVELIEEPLTSSKRQWGRVVIRPVADFGLAFAIITVISIYNLIRDPFRR